MSYQVFEWPEAKVRSKAVPSAAKLRFDLPAEQGAVSRVSFLLGGGVLVEDSWNFAFTLHSPTSNGMTLDILRGDFGFPTVMLVNAEGAIYRFARGNLKDFFRAHAANTPQRITLPLASFIFEAAIKTNKMPAAGFFDQPIREVQFDFLSNPTVSVDIELADVQFEAAPRSAQFDTLDLVVIENANRLSLLPKMLAEGSAMGLAASLSNVGSALGFEGATLEWDLLRNETTLSQGVVGLTSANSYFTLTLPALGGYILSTRVVHNGSVVGTADLPLVRAVQRQDGRATKLGVSDSDRYDRLAIVGGTWERCTVDLRGFLKDPAVGYRFYPGRQQLPLHRPGENRERIITGFAMPKWLSRLPDVADYHRYAPHDWAQYADLMKWLADYISRAGATVYETWNEPAVAHMWNDGMDDLIRLHEVTYTAMKGVNPNLKILGGGTNSWDWPFLTSFLAAGGADWSDGLNVHGYTYQPWDFLAHFDGLDDVMGRFVPASKRETYQAYISEIGFRTPAFDLDEQALNLTLYTLEASFRRTVGGILWFRYFNPSPETVSRYNQRASTGYAMVGHGERYCRPALSAYRFVERVLQHFDPDTATLENGVRVWSFLKDGKEALRAMYRASGFAVADAPIPSGWSLRDHYGARIDPSQAKNVGLLFAAAPSAEPYLI